MLSLNPFGTGQCLTTYEDLVGFWNVYASQSLWNRAVSYDMQNLNFANVPNVSIPLEQGSVLRREWTWQNWFILASQSLWNRAVSYDGSTWLKRQSQRVSIPLEQGSVLRQTGIKWWMK